MASLRGELGGIGGILARDRGQRVSRIIVPNAEDDDSKSSQRPKNRGAAWVIIPFGLVVFLKVITSFSDSPVEGIRVLATVGGVFAGFIVLYWSVVFFAIQLPSQRRSDALRKTFPQKEVYVARNIVGFTTGIVTVAPELSGTNRREYYGLVTDDLGFTIWSGHSQPVKVATVLWNQLQNGTATKAKYLGQPRWQASFTTISGHTLNMSLSHRLFGTGRFSETEANAFVRRANDRIKLNVIS